MEKIYLLQKIFGLSVIFSLILILPVVHFFRAKNRENFIETNAESKYRVVEETGLKDLPDTGALLTERSIIYTIHVKFDKKEFSKIHFSSLDGDDFFLIEWTTSPPEKEFYDTTLVVTRENLKKAEIFPYENSALFIGDILTIPEKGIIVRYGPFNPDETKKVIPGYIYIVRQFDGKILFKNKILRGT